MKYFLDTEFIEAGRRNPVTLISIGIVSEDGRSLYAVSSEFDPDDAGDWVKANVLTQLGTGIRCTVAEIVEAVKEFCNPTLHGKPEFWGYYADYDWVVFCQMFGSMVELPSGWPKYCHDIRQFADNVGNPQLPKQGKGGHNAFSDAYWNKTAYEFLDRYSVQSGAFKIAAERQRQINEEGWTPDHDDEHTECQLLDAAICYAGMAGSLVMDPDNGKEARVGLVEAWPWSPDWWKPSDDPIRNLVKAGALIAAEIDRLQRKAKR